MVAPASIRVNQRWSLLSLSLSIVEQYQHYHIKLSERNVTCKILYEDMSMVALEEIKDRKTQGADDG